ncbi:type III toxin-antitoxin system CptIN family toxin [Methanimicrococcus blatticola]|uniref:type III toxin-antitoxin system CptIN family toxin n=1 Tax=Methanimicrococcus blatticola TaxID=91560 RepID=UPI001061E033|nr:hypothetical protein [Methanimicrococcus blatticola]MBZ3935463.1 hypothetical protein [Methanimicrococcus blatticola]MCC2509106.1 hypothetical protein [Methanimicrococcus blatticola]
MIPVSSKIEKYKTIYNYNIKKNGRCDIIHFDYLANRQTVFIIQKMFPVSKRYISERYIDRNGNDMNIQKKAEEEIIIKSRRILKLHQRKIKVITPNIDLILKILIEEMNEE